jgi:hypothetical protein
MYSPTKDSKTLRILSEDGSSAIFTAPVPSPSSVARPDQGGIVSRSVFNGALVEE